MSEEFEQAHERLEHTSESHPSGNDNRRAAIIIAITASFLVLTEFAEKSKHESPQHVHARQERGRSADGMEQLGQPGFAAADVGCDCTRAGLRAVLRRRGHISPL